MISSISTPSVRLVCTMVFTALAGIATEAVAKKGTLREPVDSYLMKQAQLIANPNPRVPLVKLVKLRPRIPIVARVSLEGGGQLSIQDYHLERTGEHSIPVFGLKPGTGYRITVSVSRPEDERFSRVLERDFRTQPLPAAQYDFPPLLVRTADESRMEPGFTLLSVRRWPLEINTKHSDAQRAFTRDWGLLLGLDNQGDVIWYYRSDVRIAGVEQLGNGNLLFNLSDFRAVEIDWLGNKVAGWHAKHRPQGELTGSIGIDALAIHHQPAETESGNLLAFAVDAREVPNYYTSETDPNAPRETRSVIGDKIIEFTKRGEIVWSWNAFDHLDPYRIGYNTIDTYWQVRGFPGHLDWTHGNGLAYDPHDDSVIASFRVQDAIIKIDRPSKQIKWILGEHSDWPPALRSKLLEPIGELQWPYHAHNPRVSGENRIVVLDNGPHQARPFEKPIAPSEAVSRAVEFEIDPKAGTVRQIWSTEELPDKNHCNSFAMGDAHRLPVTGNYLVIFAMCFEVPSDLVFDPGASNSGTHYHEIPMFARIREYSAAEEGSSVVFDVELNDPHDAIGWQVYGGLRIEKFPESVFLNDEPTGISRGQHVPRTSLH